MPPHLIAWFAAILLLGCSPTPNAGPKPDAGPEPDAASKADMDESSDAAPDMPPEPAASVTLRVATFNASMFRDAPGALLAALKRGDDAQIAAVAQIIQSQRPDVLLLNEFDWDAEGRAAELFRAETLTSPAAPGLEPIEYAYVYVIETNTGLHSGADLDKNGRIIDVPGSRDYGNDAFGYGTFHGQYGMILLSMYPILTERARTFRELLWKDLPGTLIPAEWYTPEAFEVMRLSSKNHVDVPIEVTPHLLHLLVSHPTPPAFDGDEDRNGKRNHDEIRFWVDYLTPKRGASLTDDAGVQGGLPPEASFVILGDLNSDPKDGDSLSGAIQSLLAHERVQDPRPQSRGAASKSQRDGEVNEAHRGEAALDTADFSDRSVGNLRVDYALPSSNISIRDAGVVWPAVGEALEEAAHKASDHHMVWIDLELK